MSLRFQFQEVGYYFICHDADIHIYNLQHEFIQVHQKKNYFENIRICKLLKCMQNIIRVAVNAATRCALRANCLIHT